MLVSFHMQWPFFLLIGGVLGHALPMDRESIDPLQLSTYDGFKYDYSLGHGGVYKYYFSVPTHSKTEERTASGEVKGEYAFVAPEGDEFEFKYEAGRKGFQVESNALPEAPEDTDEVKKAKKEFFEAYEKALENAKDSGYEEEEEEDEEESSEESDDEDDEDDDEESSEEKDDDDEESSEEDEEEDGEGGEEKKEEEETKEKESEKRKPSFKIPTYKYKTRPSYEQRPKIKPSSHKAPHPSYQNSSKQPALYSPPLHYQRPSHPPGVASGYSFFAQQQHRNPYFR